VTQPAAARGGFLKQCSVHDIGGVKQLLRLINCRGHLCRTQCSMCMWGLVRRYATTASVTDWQAFARNRPYRMRRLDLNTGERSGLHCKTCLLCSPHPFTKWTVRVTLYVLCSCALAQSGSVKRLNQIEPMQPPCLIRAAAQVTAPYCCRLL
jgi:hypothetical protein